MYPYYKPLGLVLDTTDWRFMNFLSHNYQSQAYHYVVQGHTIEQYSQYFLRDATEDYREHQLFKKISNLFVPESPYSDPNHVYQWSQVSFVEGKLPQHTDTRTAVISIPLVTFHAPIVWYENDIEVCNYDYASEATLINTSIVHGLPDNKSQRVFFQVGGMRESYDDCISQFKI